MFDEPETTKLEDIGEFGLIKQLTQQFELKNNTLKGVGDDAAVINPTNNKVTLVTTDMLLEGIHFDLSYFPLKHLGYKAVSVNASDIYAMNGIPKQITISLGISSKFSVEAIEEIYEGIALACEKYKIDVVISDNRYGLHTTKIPCIFITHQLLIKAPFLFELIGLAIRLN